MTRSDTGDPSAGNPAAAELEAVQAATRWLIGAAATVLAALLAGMHLSSLGQLTTDQPLRLTAALIACAVGLIGIVVILFFAARVLVSPNWTLSKLAHLDKDQKWEDHILRAELAAQRGLLTPDEDLKPAHLYRRHRRLHVAWSQLQESGRTTLPDDLDTEHNTTERNYSVTNKQDVERLHRRLQEITNISERITTAANLAETRRRYRQLVWWQLPFIGALPVLAILAFVWATAVQPEPAITTSTAIHIKFVQDRSTIQQAGLAGGCAGRDVNAIAVGGSLPQPIVVSTNDPLCILDHIRITPALGTAVPAPARWGGAERRANHPPTEPRPSYEPQPEGPQPPVR
jgi:hypothetical protein